MARFSVDQRVLVNVFFVVCLVGGALVARRIAVDAYPNVELDAAVISTLWLGASPEEIDTLVTARIEEELDGIRGIDRMVSDSRPNRSTILLKLRETLTDTQVDRAFEDIRAALERVEDLPAEADKPILRRQTVFEIFPLVTVAVGYERAELEPVARAVARELRDELLEIDGVSKVDDRGLRDPELTVLVDRERLERHDLTLEEVAALLEATNRNVPAGELDRGAGELAVKAAGNYLAVRDLEQTVIRQDPEGSHVRVRDVARVVPGYEKRDVFGRFRGRDCISLPVAKEEGRNSLRLVAKIRAALDAFRARGVPEGIDIGIALDSSQIIRDRLRILLSNLALGVALVFAVLWAAMGARNAALAVVGIPFAYLVTLLFMAAIDVSVNAISLFALVLVGGMLVDDALVVLENIYRRLEAGTPLRAAIVEGVGEVVWPVTSSVFTTIAAFLPLLLMVGVTGEFFSIIPKIVTATLLASLFQCFFVLPAHYRDFGRRMGLGGSSRPPGPLRIASAALRAGYGRCLEFCVRHRYAAFVWLLAAAIVALALWSGLPTVLFPSDFQVFMVNMEMPADASLAETAEAAEVVDALLARIDAGGPFRGQIDAWTTTVGGTFTDDNYLLLSPHVAQAFVSLKQGTGVDPAAVREHVSRLIERVRASPRGSEEERIGRGLARFEKVIAVPQMDGPPTGRPVAVRVRCDDLDEAEAAAAEIQAFLRSLPGVLDVADNHDEGRVVLSLRLRRDLAAAHGITFARAARTLLAANDGLVVSVFKDPGGRDDADVRVRLDPADLPSAASLGLVRIRNAHGEAVPLASVAEFAAERTHAGIYRYDGRRTVLVTADVEESVTNATAVNEALASRFDTPEFRAAHPGVTLRFGGEYEETRKSFASLREAFLVAMLAIYMILAAQFRSYLLPLLVMLTVPFAFIGVVFGLLVTKNPFTITAGIAMIGLAGVAVNNAIVLVDFANRARAAGMPAADAIRDACRLRLRPILLTSVTTIAGLLPMALGFTGFSKLWSPFAATICFGIAFSTALTLLIVPAGYLALDDLKRRFVPE